MLGFMSYIEIGLFDLKNHMKPLNLSGKEVA